MLVREQEIETMKGREREIITVDNCSSIPLGTWKAAESTQETGGSEVFIHNSHHLLADVSLCP